MTTNLIDGFGDIIKHINNQNVTINKLKKKIKELEKEIDNLKIENESFKNIKINDISVNEYEILGLPN